MDVDVEVIRSRRKTLGLQIYPDLRVVLRVPLRCSEREIRRFLQEKQDWIQVTLQKMKVRQIEREQQHAFIEKLTETELKRLHKEAKAEFQKKAAFYAPLVGVQYGRISVRAQKTRFGSCSSQGNLNFNLTLMLAPEAIRDYVVVHELAHRKEMNHSKRFWAEVERVLPDYRIRRKWLKENGYALIGRLPD